MTKFDNKYNPKEKEAEIRKFWDENNIYKFDEKSKKKIFSIDTPPPTISGKMHIGHAYSYAQQDFIARYKRMNGEEVYFPFGTDDNGLATEKLVQKERKVNLRKVERKEAIKIVLDYLEEERPKFIQDWRDLGMSCDFNLKYSTIDSFSQKISQKSFLELVKKGLVEKRKGPVMWDRQFQTAIAQAELEDLTRKSYLSYVKAKIEDSENTFMIYATTRPELCFAVVGMSVEDEGNYVKLKVGNEYWICGAKTYEEKFTDFEFKVVEKLKGQELIGQKALIPIVNKVVEISHDLSVKADFGTGIAYFCSYGGLEDIEWVSRHGVEPVELLGKDGRLNKISGKYEGKLADEARKEIIVDMEEAKFIIKKELKEQIVNVGERSGVEVEFIVSEQWYVKYLDKKEYFWEMAEKFNWTPEFMKHRLENWIKGLNWDWGFSRQRHFGIPIPVWSCSECGKKYYPEEKQLPCDPTEDKCPVGKCDCGSSKFVGETDVFDTWFTSASSAVIASSLLGDKMFDKIYPMTLRPQSHDIINFWLFYSMAKNNLLYNNNPFRDVNISGWVLDPQGKKMSKSKGNTIAPQEVVDKYSNDAIRFAAAATKLGSDQPYQEKEVQTGLKVVNKLFNANKFASMLLENFESSDREFDVKKLRSIDRWILAKLQNVIKKASIANEKYDSAGAKSEFELFFMRDVADNYIEIVKQRLWKPDEFGLEESKKAQKALYISLYSSLRGLAPILSFITEEVYQKFYREFEGEKSIHLTKWPVVDKKLIDDEIVVLGDSFVSIVGEVRKFKSEKQVSMKAEIETLTIECSKKLKEFIENSILDLKAVTSAKNVKIVDLKTESLNEMVLDIVLAEE
ncbi:MAG: class I tRNA ligase family protein [Nanoarchaeota archaeon]|nr:class I tRNA ligase family protein [Nanoarchaeota archaeon]